MIIEAIAQSLMPQIRSEGHLRDVASWSSKSQAIRRSGLLDVGRAFLAFVVHNAPSIVQGWPISSEVFSVSIISNKSRSCNHIIHHQRHGLTLLIRFFDQS